MKVINLEAEQAMGKTEMRPITLEVIDLQADEEVTNAQITHTPPAGGGVVTIEFAVEHPYINMLFGEFTVSGWHYVNVKAIGNNGSEPETLYVIKVN